MKPSTDPTDFQRFWTPKRQQVALLLAEGNSYRETARLANVDPKSVCNWMKIDEFSAEVDRLSLMVGCANRAWRLRVAMRTIKHKLSQQRGYAISDKDVLDWLKYAQSETDGVKIDMAKLVEMLDAGDGPQVDQVGHHSDQRQLDHPARLALVGERVDGEVDAIDAVEVHTDRADDSVN
jgi:hypothetical protein